MLYTEQLSPLHFSEMSHDLCNHCAKFSISLHVLVKFGSCLMIVL